MGFFWLGFNVLVRGVLGGGLWGGILECCGDSLNFKFSFGVF